jgi:hypothetical protein
MAELAQTHRAASDDTLNSPPARWISKCPSIDSASSRSSTQRLARNAATCNRTRLMGISIAPET